MRDYAKVSPQFWTGRTGKRIRELGRDAQVVALYLVTGPTANMCGLYYLPLPVLCHETGIPSEGAAKALRSLSAIRFAQYDDDTETIWVTEMARFQVGASLKPGDLRIKGVVRELATARKCKFSRDFYEKYRVPFNLPELLWWDEEGEPPPSPSEAPSGTLRSQEQEQEQEQEQQQEQENEQFPGAAAPSALFMDGHRANGRAMVEGFALFWKKYPRKTAKRAAERAWRQLRPETGLVDQIIAAVDVQKRGGALSAELRFIPHPASWLNGRRWDDEAGNNGHVPRNRINDAWIGQPTGRVEL